MVKNYGYNPNYGTDTSNEFKEEPPKLPSEVQLVKRPEPPKKAVPKENAPVPKTPKKPKARPTRRTDSAARKEASDRIASEKQSAQALQGNGSVELKDEVVPDIRIELAAVLRLALDKQKLPLPVVETLRAKPMLLQQVTTRAIEEVVRLSYDQDSRPIDTMAAAEALSMLHDTVHAESDDVS